MTYGSSSKIGHGRAFNYTTDPVSFFQMLLGISSLFCNYYNVFCFVHTLQNIKQNICGDFQL